MNTKDSRHMRVRHLAITMGMGLLTCLLTGCSQMEPGRVSTTWMPGAEASVGYLKIHFADAARYREGTGFLFASNMVVTCLHVVNSANSAEITFPSGLSLPITGIVAEDAENDIAILTINPTDAEPPPLPLAPVPSQFGDKLVVYGYPVGPSQKICDGNVTCIGPSYGMPLAIIITAPLTHGFSGGPVLNNRSQVVGVAQSGKPTRVMSHDGKELIKKRGIIVPASRIIALAVGPSRSLREWTKARGAIASAADEEFSGSLDAEQGDKAKAFQHFQKATQLDPNNFMAWFKMGCALQDMGRDDQAMDALGKAIALKPQFPEALMAMSDTFIKQQRYPEAIDTLERCVRMNPNSDIFHLSLGLMYVVTGQSEKAREQYQAFKLINPEAAEYLLGLIQKMYTASPLTTTGSIGGTKVKNAQLIQAIKEGNVSSVQSLLADGANVNAKADNDVTVLMAASLSGHTEVVKLLLEKGADVNAKAIYGITALMVAVVAEPGQAEIVKLLLEKGADVNAKRTDVGATALMLAAEAGRAGVVKLLLQKGADVNAKTKSGVTALNMAAQNSHTDVVQLLEKAGAKVGFAEADVSDENAQLLDKTFRPMEDTLKIVKSAAKDGFLDKRIAMNATDSFSSYLQFNFKQMRDQDVEAIFSRYLNAVSEVHRLAATSSEMKATDRLAVINVSLTGVSQLLSSKKLTPSQTERITQMSKNTITKLLQAEVAAGNDLDLLLGSIPGTECARLLREMGIYEGTLQSVGTTKR